MRISSSLAVMATAWLLGGCGSTGLAGAALEATGLRKPPELSEAHKPPRTVALRLHASPRLNLDRNGQALALAVRLYKLRRKDAFEQAPYSAFLDPQAERAALGADLIEVREIMLVPGQRYEVVEKLGREAGYLALVALFQRPAGQRWRTSVAAADAERAGLSIGLHACALTVGSGGSSGGGGGGQAAMLSSVRCQ